MKISELITTLQKRLKKHGDIEVEVTWESITTSITTDAVYKSKDGPLYIDADDNFYKDKFAVDPTEGAGETYERENPRKARMKK